MERFATTRWSRIVSAADRKSPEHRRALSELCENYWYPIYAFVRRRGSNENEARDLTQGFFLSLLERDLVSRADQERGRFRTYLLVALKGFLANEQRRDAAQKRGGDHQFVSIDAEAGEERLKLEPVDNSRPDADFDRRWASELLDRSLERLKLEYESRQRLELFEILRPLLMGDDASTSVVDLAERLQMSQNSVRVAIHRLRKRYREMVRMEVAETVSADSEVDLELQELLRVMTS